MVTAALGTAYLSLFFGSRCCIICAMAACSNMFCAPLAMLNVFQWYRQERMYRLDMPSSSLLVVYLNTMRAGGGSVVGNTAEGSHAINLVQVFRTACSLERICFCVVGACKHASWMYFSQSPLSAHLGQKGALYSTWGQPVGFGCGPQFKQLNESKMFSVFTRLSPASGPKICPKICSNSPTL